MKKRKWKIGAAQFVMEWLLAGGVVMRHRVHHKTVIYHCKRRMAKHCWLYSDRDISKKTIDLLVRAGLACRVVRIKYRKKWERIELKISP